MSLSRSLKGASSLARHRNVLSRAERIAVLVEEEKLEEGRSVFGLPKVAHRKSRAGKKEKKAAETAVEEAPKDAAKKTSS
jgi:small basic protein (TIGR04137 family)